MAYLYDAQDRLATVTDDDGRGLTFAYGDCGLLEHVTDHAGRTVHYDHARDIEHLECVGVEGAGPVRSYRYESPAVSLARRHQIVAVTGGDGATFTQVAYDEDPASWSYGRVVEQLHGDQPAISARPCCNGRPAPLSTSTLPTSASRRSTPSCT